MKRRDLWRGCSVAAVLLLVGCAVTTTQRREEQLVQNARAFNDDWRWARWDAMAGVMPEEDATAFLARAQSLERELVVADFEVTSINFIEESKAAKVVAKFEWYLKRDPTIRNTTVEQRWENNDGRWQVVKLRRTRGDRFGLVTEPLAAEPGATAPPPPAERRGEKKVAPGRERGNFFRGPARLSGAPVARPDFSSLTLPHMGALYRTACRMTLRAAEAEDLVQETYLEGFRCYGSLRDPERCRPWLFRILHNLWSERRTRESARLLAAKLDPGAARKGAGNLEQELTENGYSDEVAQALATLPDEFRTAVLLVTVEELSYGEVAEVMDCPIGTVRSRVARGRALLGAALATARVEALRKETL